MGSREERWSGRCPEVSRDTPVHHSSHHPGFASYQIALRSVARRQHLRRNISGTGEATYVGMLSTRQSGSVTHCALKSKRCGPIAATASLHHITSPQAKGVHVRLPKKETFVT